MGRRDGSIKPSPGLLIGGVPIHPPLTIRPPTLCLPRSSVGVSGSHVVPHPSPAELTAEPKARAERIPSRRPEPSRAKLSERASRATAPFGTGRAPEGHPSSAGYRVQGTGPPVPCTPDAPRRPPLECRVQGAGHRASGTLGGHPSRPFRRSHLASQPTLAHSRNRSPSPPGTVLLAYLLTCLLTYLLTCLLTYLLTYSQAESVALTAGDCRPHLRSAAGGRIAT